MTVTFRSAFLEVARTLFSEAFEKEEFHTSETGAKVHFMFASDTAVRDVRAWCADAIGCGLIATLSITVEP